MPALEVVLPENVTLESLKTLYDNAGLQTELDSDGDLVVTSGVTCYVIPTRQRDRILLMAFVGNKDEIDGDRKVEFANRANNQISTVRARVNDKGRVIFDYYLPVEGGITGQAIVSATQLFLEATAQAVTQCDEDNIVR